MALKNPLNGQGVRFVAIAMKAMEQLQLNLYPMKVELVVVDTVVVQLNLYPMKVELAVVVKVKILLMAQSQ